MKVSDDQNTVTIMGVTGEFVSGGLCKPCCFIRFHDGSCKAPCMPHMRNDDQPIGNFEEVNTCK